MTTALAATLYGPEDLRMVDRPLDPLAPGAVRVRFGAGGICGSDMHYFRHARTGDFIVTSPLVLGHEIAGIVEAVGRGVSGLAPGTRVAVNPFCPCGRCPRCDEGRANLCENVFFMGSASKAPHMQAASLRSSTLLLANACRFPTTSRSKRRHWPSRWRSACTPSRAARWRARPWP